MDQGARMEVLMAEREIYRVSVPDSEKSLMDDTPDEYSVVVPEDTPDCRCLIRGRYDRRWHTNVSARWLVRHLIEKMGVSNG